MTAPAPLPTPRARIARHTLPRRAAALAVLLSLAATAGAHDLTKFKDPAAPASVRYRLGLLVRGPGWTPGRTARTDSIQAGHMANIGRMWRHGALLAAGPFENGGELRGVFVFRPGDDPLDSLMAGDSAIATQRLECRLFPWLGAPGIGEDYRHRAEQRAGQGLSPKDSMVTFGWVMLQRGPRYDSNPSDRQRSWIGRRRQRRCLLRFGRVREPRCGEPRQPNHDRGRGEQKRTKAWHVRHLGKSKERVTLV